MCQKDYCQKLRNLEGKIAKEEGSPIFFTKEEGLCTGTAVNRMIVADIHWKLIWFPLAVLGSIASRRIGGGEAKSQATSFHVLLQVNCSALRSSPRTDNTQCLLTSSSTHPHAHENPRVHPPPLLALGSVTLPRVGHSRVLYRCLSYHCLSVQRVPLRLCPTFTVPLCCTCVTTTVSHCRGTESTVTRG